MPRPVLQRGGTYAFSDFPDFRPNLAPSDIFRAGAFGGTYWRPITSGVTGKSYRNAHKEFPDAWWRGLKPSQLVAADYDKSVNRYGVAVGTSLAYWESKNWITAHDPYGWVQWYCRFFRGRRVPGEDARQIARWKGIAGEGGRFRKRIEGMIKTNAALPAAKRKQVVSPKIRQTLIHWAWNVK